MNKAANTKIIVDGFKAEISDDEMIKQLFESGVSFGELRNIFNEIVKEKGLRLTNKEIKEKVAELLVDVEKIETAEEVLSLTAKIQTKFNVSSTKAMGALRTWAKGKEITMPKTPTKSKRKPGFGGHYAKILGHAVEMRNAGKEITKEALVAFCHVNNIPEAYSAVSLNVVQFAKVWNGEIVETVDPEEAPAAAEATEAKAKTKAKQSETFAGLKKPSLLRAFFAIEFGDGATETTYIFNRRP